MSDELRRLKAQQEANSAAIARMQMMMQAQNARREDDDDDEPQPQPQPVPQQQYTPPPQPQYHQVDPNQAILQHITTQAANIAATKVQQNMAATGDVESKIKTRMQRLVADYPALSQEDSELVVKARQTYARIAKENPGLDEATKYELAVREAASLVGARPVDAPIEDIAASDFVMPAGRNPAVGTRPTKSRLTPNIIANAKLMNINVDPNTVEGKKNLQELSEYSARFNADQDESQFRYK